ncbi:MAG: flavin reductase family protein [Candidatus Dormibacteria bacterium]
MDKASFRYAMGHFATGVTIMTVAARERLHGMTVSAFASVSLEPPLILVCVEHSTLMHRLLAETATFAVNVLSERGEATSRFFADNARLDGPEFRDGSYRLGVTGSPIMAEATAFLEAKVHGTHEAGDHTVVVGEVIALDVQTEDDPLIFYRGGYRRLKG